MRILVITDNRFWRGELGSQRRIHSLCEHFARSGHEVRVLFQGYIYPLEKAQLTEVAGFCRVDTLGDVTDGTAAPPRARVRARRLVKQVLFEGRRWLQPRHAGLQPIRNFRLQQQEPKLADFADPLLLERFRTACREFRPQAILVEYARLAFLLKAGRDAIPAGCITLVDTHDLQHERQSRFHQRGEPHDIDITPAEEARALAPAEVIVAIQPADAHKLRQLVPGKTVVVAGFPNSLRRHPERNADTLRIGFIGSSMTPNVQAATLLTERLFPALRAQRGAAVELHLYGTVCESLAPSAAGSGIFLHGFVDDLTATYGELDIIANPVEFGGGLKIKNVEALCHGRPLVTTTIGAEGMEDGAGRAFLLADGEPAFAAALAALVADPARRRALGEAALGYAEAHFSEAAAYRELDAILANGRRPQAAGQPEPLPHAVSGDTID